MATDSPNTLISNGCYFLRLPGELRNLVYAYALSEPAGLEFRYDSQGIARLYHFGAAKPSPEISSTITDEGLEAHGGESEMSDANQLQYISRDIRRETRGIGIRYNRLTFDNLVNFMAFLETCPSTHTKHIRHITIDRSLYTKRSQAESVDHVQKRSKRRSEFFDFCKSNASVTIRNPLKSWRQDDPWFITNTISLQIQFRKHSKLIYDFFTNEKTQRLLETSFRHAKSRPKDVPTNMHFYPTDEIFHEDTFRTTVEGNAIIRSLLADVDGGIDRWVSVAKEIYKHGI